MSGWGLTKNLSRESRFPTPLSLSNVALIPRWCISRQLSRDPLDPTMAKEVSTGGNNSAYKRRCRRAKESRRPLQKEYFAFVLLFLFFSLAFSSYFLEHSERKGIRVVNSKMTIDYRLSTIGRCLHKICDLFNDRLDIIITRDKHDREYSLKIDWKHEILSQA